MNDDFIDKVESETESEDEVKANIHEMMYKSNVQTQSLHAHDHSSIALDESIWVVSQQSMSEDTIGDVTERGALLEKEKEKALLSGEPEEEEDKDVVLLKKRITANLEK